ncbi:PDZ domain-containing protein [Aphelenchoides avenae]|nr:PDZ domain-containing protein [Aphelenchus avenae]
MSYELVNVRLTRSNPSIQWGFSLRPAGADAVIASIEKDSMAEKAGLMVNDTVQEIFGRPRMPIAEARTRIQAANEITMVLKRPVTGIPSLPWTLNETADNKLVVDHFDQSGRVVGHSDKNSDGFVNSFKVERTTAPVVEERNVTKNTRTVTTTERNVPIGNAGTVTVPIGTTGTVTTTFSNEPIAMPYSKVASAESNSAYDQNEGNIKKHVESSRIYKRTETSNMPFEEGQNAGGAATNGTFSSTTMTGFGGQGGVPQPGGGGYQQQQQRTTTTTYGAAGGAPGGQKGAFDSTSNFISERPTGAQPFANGTSGTTQSYSSSQQYSSGPGQQFSYTQSQQHTGGQGLDRQSRFDEQNQQQQQFQSQQTYGQPRFRSQDSRSGAGSYNTSATAYGSGASGPTGQQTYGHGGGQQQSYGQQGPRLEGQFGTTQPVSSMQPTYVDTSGNYGVNDMGYSQQPWGPGTGYYSTGHSPYAGADQLQKGKRAQSAAPYVGPRVYYQRHSPRTERELSPQARIAHLQYNSPLGLYSPEAAAEAYKQQTGQDLQFEGGYPGGQRPAYMDSATRRLIAEEEAGIRRSQSPAQSASLRRIANAVGAPLD